jgi:sortase A
MKRFRQNDAKLGRIIALSFALTGFTLIAAGVVSLLDEERTRAAEANIDPATFDFAVTATSVSTVATGPAPALTTTRAAPISPAPVQATATVKASASAGKTLAAPTVETPARIIIPAINLDAPVEPVGLIYKQGKVAEWGVIDKRVAGWHNTSAHLGEVGNLVMNGHHNIRGRVFEHLKDLKPGDLIFVYGNRTSQAYTVTERRLLKERGQPLAVRLEHARYIAPTADERLTLVTCWPPSDYSHRLILIARPVQGVTLDDALKHVRSTEQ